MSIGYFQWTKIGCFRWTRSGCFRRTLTLHLHPVQSNAVSLHILILLVHSADAQVYCCNVLYRLDIASHSHADSPALLFSAHTIDIALLCSDIPISGLFLLPSLSFHTLPKHTLPALLCTSLMNSFLWESNFLSASPHMLPVIHRQHTPVLLPRRILLQTRIRTNNVIER